MMKIKKLLSTAFAAIGFAVTMISCDAHMEFPDTAMQTCDILCTDGQIVRYDEMLSKGKTPIGVVFHVNQDGKTEGTGYAVYLWDIESSAYSDSLGVKHSTSADPTSYDGNSNTYAMLASGTSPAANSVFAMWRYGQSAYIPSVAQLQLLYASRNVVNNYISKCGGDIIPDNPDECWYWSSTEVSGQESMKAWLFSLASGALQETPKLETHKIRPIITLYN
jgi:hypothetical protein